MGLALFEKEFDQAGYDRDAIVARNKFRRLQIQVAMATNIIITCQAIAAAWSADLRAGLIEIWPVLSVIYGAGTTLIISYILAGSSENKHSAEIAAVMSDPRLRKGFNPPGTKTIDPRKTGTPDQRDDTPDER